ncbi:MAG TPA: hypothetical protein VE987_21445 [Polyangiaceae bacterium]|nr:hypothetical protein [Polyangiaceae bacterium]
MGVALGVVLVAFGAAHGALVVGLAATRPRWRALAALLVAPLAPWWGWQAGMRRRTAAWGLALALYVIGLAIATGW